MDDLPQTDVPTTSEKPEDNAHHVGREKKIDNPTITHLLHATRRIVEEKAWEDGMLWYPDEMLHRTFPARLAKRVFPDAGTTAAKACARAIRSHTGKTLTEEEARDWLTDEIERRLGKYVIGAREKIDEIRLVVTKREIKVRAQRPDTTRKAVGPAPWPAQI